MTSKQFDSAQISERPCGTFRDEQGVVTWRVWAPRCEQLELVLYDDTGGQNAIGMESEPEGYFVARQANATGGQRYAYRLPDGMQCPDPASRWQPDGVHRPSALYFPEDYAWTAHSWRGLPTDELLIYELHVGTFTPRGTFASAVERLPALVELGITAIEIMPVAQFPGARNWGYDGVYPYAVQNSYGGPSGLQALVDAAHELGLAVILDVVYNHLGPEGNYLGQFGHYFTDRYRTPWGMALNYDGPDSDPVRRFVFDNACMWVRDYRIDALRLDAVHSIFDLGARHLLAQLQDEVQAIARAESRRVQVIAESDQNDVRLIRSAEHGGYALDGVWSDDFHHSVHALLTGEENGYYADFGSAEELARAYSDVFVYDGCYSPFRRRHHGSRTGDLPRERFVVCVQNHDQVGNRAIGDRFGTLLSPAAQRLAASLLLLHPGIPLIFMGQEYGETNPFPFFCSFEDPSLVEAVRRGRRAEFEAFGWSTDLPDPQAEATFDSAVLRWEWPEGTFHQGLRQLYADLLRARRDWPALRARRVQRAWVDDASSSASADHGPALLVAMGTTSDELTIVANLTDRRRPWPKLYRDGQTSLLSSEATRYGGSVSLDDTPDMLLPYECRVFGPIEY